MSGERILVVDDSQQIVRHLTEQVLPTFGFKTLFALNGRKGLEMIRKEKPDLVMLDLNLPEMTGLDVLRSLVQDGSTVPVVLMTGYGSEKSAIEAFRLGVKDYIIKPFSVDEVLETINRSLIETRLRHDKQQLAEQLRRAHVEMRRRVNEMSTLFGIGKAVASLLSVKKVLDRVLEAAIYVTSAEESTIWLLDKETDQLNAYAKKGTRDVEPQVQKLPAKDSQVGKVLSSGRPLRESAFSGKGITLKTGYSARAILYVPLMLRGQTMGVVSVSNRSAPRSFSERDEALLSALADYAAIALENARVFQETDRALAAGNEELRTLMQITRAITSSLNLDEVVRLTIKQVHDSWQIEASSLWLLDKEQQALSSLANVGTPSDVLKKFKIPVGQGFVGTVVQSGQPIYSNEVEEHPLHFREVDFKTGFSTRSLLCVPLMFRDEVIGALQLLNKFNGGFDENDVERAVSIATAVAIGVTNAMLFRQSESRQQQLEATLEHNGNPIIITDLDNNLLLLNQQARNYFELARSAIGRPVSEVIAVPELASFLTQPLDGQAARRAEIALPDESVWLSTLAPIPEYGRILILQDITYLKELDRTKSSFVATVSHDLRAPLTSITGFANALQDAGTLNDEQLLYMNRIIRSAEWMTELINGLLDLAKVTTRIEQNQEICDVADIAGKAVVDLQGQAMMKDIDLRVTIAEDIAPIRGDATLLRQAISNLIDNAIKYSSMEKPVDVDISNQNDVVLVQVKDEGQGIAKDDLPHIFEQFYRSKQNNNLQGIGLGLTLVRSIAEAHGGQVWVESEAGQGSTFALRLPAADMTESEEPA